MNEYKKVIELIHLSFYETVIKIFQKVFQLFMPMKFTI